MRVLALVGVACLILKSLASASPQVSSDDAELMQIEALADRAPDRVQGGMPYLSTSDETPDSMTGGNAVDPDDCSRVPVFTKRSDGRVVKQFVDVCD